jgi:hypothetical protein
MKKIVELIIGKDGFEFDETGVQIVSFVESPAIGIDWLAFSKQEKVQFVKPESGEQEDQFIGRCIPELIGEGYSQEEATAICYSYWKEEMNHAHSCEFSEADDKVLEIEEKILEWAQNVGQEFDEYIMVDLNGQQFNENSLITDALNALSALDILGRRGANREELQRVWKYENKPGTTGAQRRFCNQMLRLNRVYTADEMRNFDKASSGFNPGFGQRGSRNSYNIFYYAGGNNCKHQFVEYFMSKEGMRAVLIPTGRVGAENVTINQQFMNFNVVDTEKREVLGPAMVPSMLIPRLDEDGNEYYVYFSKSTIKQINEKFMKFNYQNNTDVNHDDNITTKNVLLESWLVEDPKIDKSILYGFEPEEGWWFLRYKVNDDETWQKIKNGELKGFSISGHFLSNF